MRHLAIIMAIVFAAFAARAGDVVLSVEGGMVFGGDSGLRDIGPLERDEIATGFALAAGVGYQFPVAGGRFRTTFGVDYTGNTDGDWGHSEPVGDYTGTIRQLVNIHSVAAVLALGYDATELNVAGFFPFAEIAGRLQHNKLTHQSTTLTLSDGEKTKSAGCIGDDTSSTPLGWHVRGGIARDIDNWTVRAFYQYTDRGDVRTASCFGMPSEKLSLTDSRFGVGVSYAF